MPNPRHQITGPTITPAPFGLLSAVEVRDEADPRWRNGIEWRSTCPAQASVTVAECSADVEAGGDYNALPIALLRWDEEGAFGGIDVLTFLPYFGSDEVEVRWTMTSTTPEDFDGTSPTDWPASGPWEVLPGPTNDPESDAPRLMVPYTPEPGVVTVFSVEFRIPGTDCVLRLAVAATPEVDEETGVPDFVVGSINDSPWGEVTDGAFTPGGYRATMNGYEWTGEEIPPHETFWLCPEGQSVPGSSSFSIPAKTATGETGFVEGPAVTLYAVHECSPVGETDEQAQAEAGRKLAAGEGPALETVVQAGVTEAGLLAPEFHLNGAGANNITPGSMFTTPEVAIAAVEGTLLARGVGVIYVPVNVASYLLGKGSLVRNGGRIETPLGTPVAAMAGYDIMAPGPDGSKVGEGSGRSWIYGTGPAIVYRGGVTYLPGFDARVNTRTVIAERTYAYGWECDVVAAAFQLPDLIRSPAP